MSSEGETWFSRIRDPPIEFAFDWLRRSVPDYDSRVVLVQGDTGPGNFLYAPGRSGFPTTCLKVDTSGLIGVGENPASFHDPLMEKGVS